MIVERRERRERERVFVKCLKDISKIFKIRLKWSCEIIRRGKVKVLGEIERGKELEITGRSRRERRRERERAFMREENEMTRSYLVDFVVTYRADEFRIDDNKMRDTEEGDGACERDGEERWGERGGRGRGGE